jgi:CspA family cold shock protein
VVVEFDDHRGVGTVRGDDGSDHFFHCTRIADGTRTIEEGTRVVFEVVPGHGGRWEAAAITAL